MRLLVLLTFTVTLLALRPEGAAAVTELRSLGRISKPFVPKVQRARPVGRWREEHSCAPPALLLEQLEIVPRRQVRDIAQRGHKFVVDLDVGVQRCNLQMNALIMRARSSFCAYPARDLIALLHHHCLRLHA